MAARKPKSEQPGLADLVDRVDKLTALVEKLLSEREAQAALSMEFSPPSPPSISGWSGAGPVERAMVLDFARSSATAKITYEETTIRLLMFLPGYCNVDKVFLWHELEGIPVLGLSPGKKAALKGPLEQYVYKDVELKLQHNDIPPQKTVSDLRDKIWERIDKKFKK